MKWKTVTRKLSELKPWKRNPRQIDEKQAERLKESFEAFGQVETIAIGPKNEVYNGHQRLNVLMDQHGGDYEVECRQSERKLTEKEREKLTVFLHRGATGDWDWDILANEFEMEELVEWGFDEAELIGFEEEPKEAPEPKIDEADKLLEKWKVETGQLWQLGDHRLICGDCTDKAVVDRLMDGEADDLLLTDPPYGVNYGAVVSSRKNQKVGGWADIENDNLDDDEFYELLSGSLSKSKAPFALVWYGFRRTLIFWKVLEESGWSINEPIIWVKNALVFGRADYQWQHEQAFYCKRDGATGQDDRTKTTVWEIDKPHNSMHPSQKPVELMQIPVQNHTNKGGIVFDPFLGSGSTLMACENLNRKCYGIEIEPKYVAVTLERWHEMTGEEPTLLDT